MTMGLNRSGLSLSSAILLMSCHSLPSILLINGLPAEELTSVDFSEADITVAEKYLEKINSERKSTVRADTGMLRSSD